MNQDNPSFSFFVLLPCFFLFQFIIHRNQKIIFFLSDFKATPHRLCREAKDDLVMMLEAEIPDIHVEFKTDVYQPGQHDINENTLHRMKICVQMPGVKAVEKA